MDSTTRVPLARSQGLVIEELGDELLVYDLDVDRAHCLGATAARVWRRCDGRTRSAEIADELGLGADELLRALDELDRCKLLIAPAIEDGGLSRRDFGLRVVKAGALAASVPLVVSIAVPATAAATVTEAFCQAIITSGHGCGECHQAGCCCCDPPQGSTKPCHASCLHKPSDCQPAGDNSPNCNGPSSICKLD
ncbi:MAG: hypothetical protein QOE31_337 [Solirubrobacteraceae bacterium]|jgi:hypothetical protein|nr:hypothetical protein [Solirubrobacteraceae bacterium]